MERIDLSFSAHFTLVSVADGVYAALATPGGGALGNAAIVDLGDRTLVFDTMATLHAARDLRQAAERLTGRSPTLVVNSHWHGDHVYGNQVFLPEAVIAATATTRAIMDERVAVAIPREFVRVQAQIPDLRCQLAQVTDDAQRHRLNDDLAFARLRATSLPEQRACLPTATFEDRVVFHGSGRKAELLTYGGGHTRSDAFLYLPDEGLALMGDLLFVHVHPLFIWGDPRQWRRIIERVKTLGLRIVVPGHGPVGTVDDLDALAGYLSAIKGLALSVVESGGTLDQALRRSMPAPFDSWDTPDVFEANMTFLLAETVKKDR